MTYLSRVLDMDMCRSPSKTQCYGILDMSLKIIVVQGGRTHTKTNKQTKINTTINLKESTMITSAEDWPGLKIRTPKITFSRN